MNATNASLGPSSPPVEHQHHDGQFRMSEGTAIALVVSSAIGSLLVLVAATIVLVVVTKQLHRLVVVLRGEEGGTGVHMSLLAAANAPPLPAAFAVANRPMCGVRKVDVRTGDCGGGGGGSHPTGASSSSSSNHDGKRGILKKPTARMPSLTRHEKSRNPKTDEHNTSCAIHEVDEEDDHTL